MMERLKLTSNEAQPHVRHLPQEIVTWLSSPLEHHPQYPQIDFCRDTPPQTFS
jgi:hypothetical protein